MLQYDVMIAGDNDLMLMRLGIEPVQLSLKFLGRATLCEVSSVDEDVSRRQEYLAIYFVNLYLQSLIFTCEDSAMGVLASKINKASSTSIAPPPSILLSNPRETYFVGRPSNKRDDTPLRTIYRIYWAIVMNDTIFMRNELEYFWFQKGDVWRLVNIGQPNDPNPERLAMVAAIMHILAAAFNRLIDLGLPRQAATSILTNEELDDLQKKPKSPEQVPQWAVDLPPLETPLVLPTGDEGAPGSIDDEDADPFMALKNILVWRLHIYFT
ncbi:Hypothetical predicted protein [Lecanosticta acicola]|uniref:Uncharacterized protein n=1 Tax=Lecanosticta acicola TaxID=111012 RepID=A0AAI8YTL3_9PEZI|nr:Hypothetical predicted protein [Lecanosticta acicola]